MKTVGWLLGIYLAFTLLAFFVGVIIDKYDGGRFAIDMFYFYLPDSWRQSMADAMFSALKG